MHALHKLLRTLSLYQPYFVMMHVNEGCGFLVHGNNGLQMQVLFHHVLYVHSIEMNNPSFLACFQPCGICSIFLILCLKKMIKWTWKSWYLQPRYQMHCKSDPTSPFLLGREHNNCVLSLELPVKSPCLHPLFHSLFPLSSGICKVNFCKFVIFLKSQYEMLELSMHKVPE